MAEIILAINAGSSSVKVSVYKATENADDPSMLADIQVAGLTAPPATLTYARGSEKVKGQELKEVHDAESAFQYILSHLTNDKGLPELSKKEDIQFACHRVVHGGDYPHAQVIDIATYHHLEELSDLAPLHNAGALGIVHAVQRELPKATNIAYFDSAFHATIPEHIRTYAIDQKIAKHNKLRKYGFHGISYAFITRSVARYLGKQEKETNIIALHLGSGASACAIKKGQSLDTSMGLTPLAGLPGATRSGDVDPSLVFHYTHDAGKPSQSSTKEMHITEAEEILNKQSGWSALTGTTDFGKIISSNDPQCRLAVNIFVDRILGFVGSYYVKLSGDVDALVFAGGIGEKGNELRRMVVERCRCLGFDLDEKRNNNPGHDVVANIGMDGARHQTLLCHTDEQFEMARGCVTEAATFRSRGAELLLNQSLQSLRVLFSSGRAFLSLTCRNIARGTPLDSCVLPAEGSPPSKTSSFKKRRLCNPTTSETAAFLSSSNRSSPLREVVSLEESSSSSQPCSTAGDQTSSRSSPQYIPQHLRSEGCDHDPDTGSPSTAQTSTVASSPSGACAGLALDSDPAGEMTDSEDNVTSRGDLQMDVHGHPNLSTRQGVTLERTIPLYPPSPGKRPVSALVDTADESALRQQQQPDNPSQNKDSVDMLDDEQPSTSSSATLSSGTVSQSSQTQNHPTVDEQVERVKDITQHPLKEGQHGYVVSMRWLARVLARTTAGQKSSEFDKSSREGEVGPIDNALLVVPGWDRLEFFLDEKGHPYVPIRPRLQMGEDFEVLPEEAWNLIVSWYGQATGCPTIRRYAHDTAPEGAAQENVQYELRPLIFTIRKIRNDRPGMTTQTLKESNFRAVKALASRSELFQKFLKRIKILASVDMRTKVQVWRVIEVLPATDAGRSGMLTPASSRSASPTPASSANVPALQIDVQSFTAMVEGVQREMLDMKDETMNEKYNGHLRLSTIGFAEDQTLILEEQIGGPGGGEWISDSVRKAGVQNGVAVDLPGSLNATLHRKLNANTSTASGRTSPAPSGTFTRGRIRKDGRTRGTVGLTNLGNTCYMNSALQCVRSVEELADYFLEGHYKGDINADNPLGYGGSIAKTYAAFVHSIYGEGATSSFAPKLFKNTIGRHQPLFSGYGQQDSQEFLSFLVDALHEDLNRIRKKPYIENPESDDRTVRDAEAIRALGAKFRQNHKARNDSVVMDLFNGFYKNTMICPVCNKVSVTFDPFSSLTLQLPIENTWTHDMIIAPLRHRPFKLTVDLSKNGTIRTLKENIAKRVSGFEDDKLFIAEIYNHKFYKIFEDSSVIAEANIQANDHIVAYELEATPTNFPAQQNTKRPRLGLLTSSPSSDEESTDTDSPMAERIIVPVFHRCDKPGAFRSSKSFTSWPSVVLLTREEARDYDAILKKILARVATVTTRPILTEGMGMTELGSSQEDSDTILTTEDDASSDTGSKIHTTSVDGEDGLVDVSMAGAYTSSPGVSVKAGQGNGVQTAGDPEVLRPGTLIPPMLQNMFEMKYFRSSTELVPTGWNSMNETIDYPSLASRITSSIVRRPSAASTHSQRRPSDCVNHSDSEESVNCSIPAGQVVPLSHEPDSDAEDFPTVEDLARSRTRSFHTKPGIIKTYSSSRQSFVGSSENTGRDNGPLIRLREGIILDWNSDAFDALFGGEDGDEMRGQFTPERMEYQRDPELEAKRAKRAARKRSGVSLDDCFTETAKSEILSEENAWYCSRCKELRRASKTLNIWTAPDILVVHLKRFSANRGFRDKIDVLVDFPVEALDLNGKVGEAEEKTLIYDLFAVDNHYGGLGGGHYTAFAKNFNDGKWYEYNDSLVGQTKPESVVTTAAYLLFYRRRSDHPLGPPYLQEIVEESRNPDSETISRSSSPAGDGQRLGDSFRNGSPSAFQAGGLDHQLAAGGLTGDLQARSDNQLVPFNPNDDEGIGLEDDETLPDYSTVQRLPDYNRQENWSFSRLDNEQAGPQNSDNDDLLEDAPSDRVLAGSEMSAGLDERLLEDFGDDVTAPIGTPLGISQPATPIEHDDSALHIAAAGLDDEDELVAEVRLDQEKPDDIFVN